MEAKMTMVAKTYLGLEEVLADELNELGAKNIQLLNSGVEFTGGKALMYACNLRLRTATRVLVLLSKFRARNIENYCRSIQQIDWSELMGLKDSFSVDVNVLSETFAQSNLVTGKSRDTISDQIRLKTGRKPNINHERPTLRVHIDIFEQDCGVYLDSGSEPLQWRGWRKGKEEGGMSDALTAGMIMLSGWRGEPGFLDGMCDSGQALCEAAMIAARIAPGLTRDSFSFQRWRDYEPELFKSERAFAIGQERALPAAVRGWTRSPIDLKVAQRNFLAAGLTELIQVEKLNFTKEAPGADAGLLWIRSEERVEKFYEDLSDIFKQRYKGWQVCAVGPEVPAFNGIHLRAAQRHQLTDGRRNYLWARFELYEGRGR